MMQFFKSKTPRHFIGRTREVNILKNINRESNPFIAMVYGRRRIGKTTLIEHSYKECNLLKFEGIQTKLLNNKRITDHLIKNDKTKQIEKSLNQLLRYIDIKEEKDRLNNN